MIEKGRQVIKPLMKYSDELVLEIFSQRERGLTVNELKVLYPNVNEKYIYQITSGRVLMNRNLITI
jgi:hypothetical protein